MPHASVLPVQIALGTDSDSESEIRIGMLGRNVGTEILEGESTGAGLAGSSVVGLGEGRMSSMSDPMADESDPSASTPQEDESSAGSLVDPAEPTEDDDRRRGV